MGYKLELYAYLQKREGDRSDQFLGDTIYIDSRMINLTTVEKGDDLQPVVKSMLIRTINLFSKDKDNELPTRPDTGSWLRLYDTDEFIQIEWLDASVKISASNMDSGNMIVLYVDDNGISIDYGSFNMTEILLSGEKNMICHEILEWAVVDCNDRNVDIGKDRFTIHGTTEVLNRIKTYMENNPDDPIEFEIMFHLVQPFFFISTSDENCVKLKNNIKEYEKRFDLFNIPEEVGRNNCGAAFFVRDLDIDDEDSDTLADNNDIENSVSTICDTSKENEVTFKFRIKHNGKSITYTNCTPLELFEDDIINEDEYRALEEQFEAMKASDIDDSNYYDPIKHEIDRFSIEGEEE